MKARGWSRKARHGARLVKLTVALADAINGQCAADDRVRALERLAECCAVNHEHARCCDSRVSVARAADECLRERRNRLANIVRRAVALSRSHGWLHAVAHMRTAREMGIAPVEHATIAECDAWHAAERAAVSK